MAHSMKIDGSGAKQLAAAILALGSGHWQGDWEEKPLEASPVKWKGKDSFILSKMVQ